MWQAIILPFILYVSWASCREIEGVSVQDAEDHIWTSNRGSTGVWRKLHNHTHSEKLIASQLVKKFPIFTEPEESNSSPLDPVLNQMNPVHILTPISLRFTLILSSNLRLGLPSGLFFSYSPPVLRAFLIFHACYMKPPSYLP